MKKILIVAAGIAVILIAYLFKERSGRSTAEAIKARPSAQARAVFESNGPIEVSVRIQSVVK